MKETFSISEINKYNEWDYFISQCRYKSLPQSWEYGSAKFDSEGWMPIRLIVRDEANKPLTIIQVLIKKIRFVGGVARINKGPLVISNELRNNDKVIFHSLKALTKYLKIRKIWLIQLAPLLQPDDESENILNKLGFRRRPNTPADSGLISLQGTEQELMMSFNGKWRNLLRKGQKLGVKVKHSNKDTIFFNTLLKDYKLQQKQKSFTGTSDAMLKALKDNQSTNFKFDMFIAYIDDFNNKNNILGSLISIQYYDFSEYLIGISSNKGRKMQANSVLLWHALLETKKNNGMWFDIGGLNKTTPKGIETFKKGMNPELYFLIGEWRKWF
jgi:lipid II:glycine glycyltransferase (peptidoglycan interpeptide bridge formation enzyme)